MTDTSLIETSNKPLNLCFVADASNIHVKRWLVALVNRGHQVTCLADKGGAIEGVNVIDLPNRDDLQQWGKKTNKTTVLKERARKIQLVVQNLQPDVIHAIFLYQRGWSAALADCQPLVITLLGSDIFLPEKNYRNKLHLMRDKALNQGALQQAQLVTTVNQNLADEAQKLCQNQLPIKLTPIGTDLTLFNTHCDEEQLTQLKSQLNITDDHLVVLSPRQITPLYNIDLIIDSFAKALKQQPNLILILKDTACNTEERQQYKATLQQQVKALNIQHFVRWVDEVPYTQLPLYFHLAHMVISIPKTDGLPVTLFDSMACKVPCITGDLPSYNNIIEHENTGLRVAFSSEAIAVAILQLAQNTELRNKIISNSDTVLQQYGVFENTMNQMERYYYQLAKQPATVASQFNQILYKMLIKLS